MRFVKGTLCLGFKRASVFKVIRNLLSLITSLRFEVYLFIFVGVSGNILA